MNILGTLLAAGLLFYVGCVNYIEQTSVGIAWNFVRGELSLLRSGWHVSSPWTWVARVDTRPVRVCITSTSRSFDCRLVQFQPSEYREFVATQGFYYYWWSNRISFNAGYDEEYRGMKDVLRGYAYSAKPYSFVKTLRTYDTRE